MWLCGGAKDFFYGTYDGFSKIMPFTTTHPLHLKKYPGSFRIWQKHPPPPTPFFLQNNTLDTFQEYDKTPTQNYIIRHNKFICYVVTHAYAHAPSREDTRIVKGEKGEYRGGKGRGEGKESVEGRGKRERKDGRVQTVERKEERGEYHMVCWGYLRCPLRTLRSSYNQIVQGSRIYATVVQLHAVLQYGQVFHPHSSLKGVKIQSLNLLYGVYIVCVPNNIHHWDHFDTHIVKGLAR